VNRNQRYRRRSRGYTLASQSSVARGVITPPTLLPLPADSKEEEELEEEAGASSSGKRHA
jgi:hypothetical protein